MTRVATQPESLARVDHWLRTGKIYLIEGVLLGIFMISACGFVVLMEYPSSPVRGAIESPLLRRAIIGLAMGLTAITLIYSPWGKRTGALMNPATTICFWRLGRLKRRDAAGYIAGQFIGASLGVATMAWSLGSWVRSPSVNYVTTRPGPFAPATVWLAEFAIALVMMTVVLAVNNIPKLAPYTGCFAGALVALYITFEAPISGMSLNPARTFGSAINAGQWDGWWIYLTAPTVGMLAAIEMRLFLTPNRRKVCGKLSHSQHICCHIECDCLGRS